MYIRIRVCTCDWYALSRRWVLQAAVEHVEYGDAGTTVTARLSPALLAQLQRFVVNDDALVSPSGLPTESTWT
jgi:hypothetical protein